MEFTRPIDIMAKEALAFNKAKIIKEDEYALIIDDSLAKICHITLKKEIDDIAPLILEARGIEPTVSLVSLKDRDIKLVEGFSRTLKAIQFSYHGDKIFLGKLPYRIIPMQESDFAYLKRNYYRNGDDEGYLLDAIKRGMLKAINGQDEIMGFIGEHPEHAMGMLYIDERFRRQGIGRNLEKAMINSLLSQGKVPFDHVVLDNSKSLGLQHSIEGMAEDEGFVYWFF